MEKFVVIGAGGFASEAMACLEAMQLSKSVPFDKEDACFLVDDFYYNKEVLMGYKIFKMSEFSFPGHVFIVAIANPKEREHIIENLPDNLKYFSIIHPSASISAYVELGEGAIITQNVVITCNIKIGKHAQLNLSTTIGHNCVIGDFLTTAPGVHISGNCDIGNRVYLGTNVSIRENTSIIDDVVVGMGANVIKSINKQGTYIGSPAKILIK